MCVELRRNWRMILIDTAQSAEWLVQITETFLIPCEVTLAYRYLQKVVDRYPTTTAVGRRFLHVPPSNATLASEKG